MCVFVCMCVLSVALISKGLALVGIIVPVESSGVHLRWQPTAADDEKRFYWSFLCVDSCVVCMNVHRFLYGVCVLYIGCVMGA